MAKSSPFGSLSSKLYKKTLRIRRTRGSESVESIDSRPTVKKTDEVEKVKDVSEDDLDPDLSPPARLMQSLSRSLITYLKP